jgi:hypothetical protein
VDWAPGESFRRGVSALPIITLDALPCRSVPLVSSGATVAIPTPSVRDDMRTHPPLAAGLIAALSLSGSTATVEAQMFRCSSNHLNHSDQSGLAAAMRSALPHGVVIDSQPSICWNPDSARSWLETRHKPNPEGFDEWWELSCSREQASWSCDHPAQKRELKMQRLVGGTMRKLIVEFNSDTSVGQARNLVGQVFDLFETGAAMPKECGGGTTNAWTQEKERFGPKPADSELDISITRDKQEVNVELGRSSGLEFTFDLDAQPSGQATLRCWAEWVVVTQSGASLQQPMLAKREAAAVTHDEVIQHAHVQ